jgi:uncharacterized protein YhaN
MKDSSLTNWILNGNLEEPEQIWNLQISLQYQMLLLLLIRPQKVILYLLPPETRWLILVTEPEVELQVKSRAKIPKEILKYKEILKNSKKLIKKIEKSKKNLNSSFGLFDHDSTHCADRRRKSGSRTSHGSRGKTLRLSLEQKLGISDKEIELLEADLTHFRTNIKISSQRGAAEIEERALKLREVVKTRETMLPDFEACLENEDGKKRFNYDKIYAVFQRELREKKRLVAKLRDKNGVLKHQKQKLLSSVKIYLYTKEVK